MYSKGQLLFGCDRCVSRKNYDFDREHVGLRVVERYQEGMMLVGIHNARHLSIANRWFENHDNQQIASDLWYLQSKICLFSI